MYPQLPKDDQEEKDKELYDLFVNEATKNDNQIDNDTMERIEILLNDGAYPDAFFLEEKKKGTFLQYAYEIKNVKLVELLLRAGASPFKTYGENKSVATLQRRHDQDDDEAVKKMNAYIEVFVDSYAQLIDEYMKQEIPRGDIQFFFETATSVEELKSDMTYIMSLFEPNHWSDSDYDLRYLARRRLILFLIKEFNSTTLAWIKEHGGGAVIQAICQCDVKLVRLLIEKDAPVTLRVDLNDVQKTFLLEECERDETTCSAQEFAGWLHDAKHTKNTQRILELFTAISPSSLSASDSDDESNNQSSSSSDTDDDEDDYIPRYKIRYPAFGKVEQFKKDEELQKILNLQWNADTADNAKILLEAGAYPDGFVAFGEPVIKETFLAFACRHRHDTMTKMLLYFGADPHQINESIVTNRKIKELITAYKTNILQFKEEYLKEKTSNGDETFFGSTMKTTMEAYHGMQMNINNTRYNLKLLARLRWIRELFEEQEVSANDLIFPSKESVIFQAIYQYDYPLVSLLYDNDADVLTPFPLSIFAKDCIDKKDNAKMSAIAFADALHKKINHMPNNALKLQLITKIINTIKTPRPHLDEEKSSTGLISIVTRATARLLSFASSAPATRTRSKKALAK